MTGAQALLADYVRSGSDHAFRELVGAYVNFVFSIALRVVGGDRHLAEDVTQTVFTDLARKAPLLPENLKLGGWLHRHTCFVGRKALRREHRRRERERRALELQVIGDYTDENLGQVATVLDEAINTLGTEDRNAIVLRFFEQLDFRSVGKALGSSEDAARMRVSRAVEKLGALLKRRGIALSAAGLGFILATKTATAAPPGLAAGVCKLALAQGAAQMGPLTLLKQVCVTKLNVSLVAAAALIATATLFLSMQPTEAEPELGLASALPEPAQDDESPQPLAMEHAQASPSQLIAELPPKVDPSSPASLPEKITPPALVQNERVRPLAPVVPPVAVRPAAANPSIRPMAQARPVVSIPRSEPAFSASTWPRERSWESDKTAQRLSVDVLTSPPARALPATTPSLETGRAGRGLSLVPTPATRRQWQPVLNAGPPSTRVNPAKAASRR